MNTFFAHIGAFIKAKGLAIVHAWPGFIAVAFLALNGFEVKTAAIIGAVVHAVLQYFHFDGSNSPVAPVPSAAPTTNGPVSETAAQVPPATKP